MLQLLYISTARAPITAVTCDDMLRTSRRNNQAAGITGLMIVGHRRFLQALEGPDDQVRATYDRITADRRHQACVILSRRQIARRNFGNWAMGFGVGGDESLGSSDLPATIAALVAPIDDANLRAQFSGFIDVQSAAA